MRRLLSNRRGLLAAAAALLGAGLAKLGGPERAEATHGSAPPGAAAGLDTIALHVGQSNSAAATTYLVAGFNGTSLYVRSDAVGGADASALVAFSSNGAPGVKGTAGGTTLSAASRVGVQGIGVEYSDGIGVLGQGRAVGVRGRSVNVLDSLIAGTGVLGESSGGSGVQGQSTSGAGVFGMSQSNAAVFGTSPFAGVAGLSSNNAGVQGISTNGGGVVGQSTNNAGVYGTSPFAGVWGTTSTGIGVYGQATSQNGFAGQFSGRVYVSGSFTVVNGAKSAAVKRKDGSHARVYCQESPEPWFEDFGTGQLVNGQAAVALSSDFDEVVDGTDYRVFLTEIGDCGGLFVSTLAPHRFDVKSRAGASARGTFHYRVVAKRADPVGTRMEKVDLPTPPQATQAPRVLSADELPKPPGRPDERPAAPGRDR